MGSGEQWSVDTVSQVKALMSIGLPLPRIAAQTCATPQTPQDPLEFEVCEKCRLWLPSARQNIET